MLCVLFLGSISRSYRALQILASASDCKLNSTFEEVFLFVLFPTKTPPHTHTLSLLLAAVVFLSMYSNLSEETEFVKFCHVR